MRRNLKLQPTTIHNCMMINTNNGERESERGKGEIERGKGQMSRFE